MRPIPISDELLRQFPIGAIRRVYAAPSGDLLDPVVPPAEGVVYQTPISGTEEGSLHPVTCVVLKLEDGELEDLQQGGLVVMGWPGYNMPVFMTPWVLR